MKKINQKNQYIDLAECPFSEKVKEMEFDRFKAIVDGYIENDKFTKKPTAGDIRKRFEELTGKTTKAEALKLETNQKEG